MAGVRVPPPTVATARYTERRRRWTALAGVRPTMYSVPSRLDIALEADLSPSDAPVSPLPEKVLRSHCTCRVKSPRLAMTKKKAQGHTSAVYVQGGSPRQVAERR